jgi:hypothetical protein
MLDFVEAMNPEVKFKREFTVLKDRDLTGELKDIWLAIQVKREREKERTENGKKLETGDREKRKEGRDEDSDKQRKVKIIDQSKERGKCTEAFPTWFAIEQEQNIQKENGVGTEHVGPHPSNHIRTKPDQDGTKKCAASCEGNGEEEGLVKRPFETDIKKLRDTAVRRADCCEVAVTPSRRAEGSPTRKQNNKTRSCESELPIQTVQHSDEINNGKADFPRVNEIGVVTKHAAFKEMFPLSSDSSEDEERGELRLNDLHEVTNNETDPEQTVGLLQDVGVSSVSQGFNNIRTDSYIDDNASSSGLELRRSQKAICVAEACTCGSRDLKNSNVKHCKFVCMKYSDIKNSTNRHLSGKQNVHVASKFKGPEQADYESGESCLAHVGRLQVLVPIERG